MGSFSESISRFAASAVKDTSTTCANIARNTFRTAINLTPSPQNNAPYSTGLLVNNWFVGYGVIEDGLRGKDSSGSGSRSSVESISNDAFIKYKALYLTNPLDYAYRADRVGWSQSDNPRWKGAAPYHFVSGAITYVSSLYK